MITPSPMLACPGSFGPGIVITILSVAGLWLAAAIAGIASLALTLRNQSNANSVMTNLGYFVGYVLLGVGVLTGFAFKISDMVGILLVFLVPALAIWHFFHLFITYRRERNAMRLTDCSGEASPSADLDQ